MLLPFTNRLAAAPCAAILCSLTIVTLLLVGCQPSSIPVTPTPVVDDAACPVQESPFTAEEQAEIDKFLAMCAEEYGNDVNVKTINDESETLLHLAAGAHNGNITVVKFLIFQGANIHAKDRYCRTPLHVAAVRSENLEIVKYLVSVGADVNAKGDYNSTPLGRAVGFNENLEVVEFLVTKGADVNAKSPIFDGTLLHMAAWGNKNVEIAKFLVSKGLDVRTKDSNGTTPLHDAARRNENVEVAKFLVTEGADVNAKNNNGKTPLDVAKEAKNTAVVEYLSGVK